MNRKTKLVTLVLSSTLAGSALLAGCERSQTASGGGSHNKKGVYREIGGWTLPPNYQGNVYGAGGVGAAYNWVYDGLFQKVRSSEKIYNHMAESFEQKPGQTIVHLRKDVKWNDGKPFTSKDVWAYYTLNNGALAAKYLSSVETPDDYTVIFNWIKPEPLDFMQMQILANDTHGTIAYHQYQKYVDKAAEILKQAKPSSDPKDQGRLPFGLKLTDDQKKALDSNWQDFIKSGPKLPLGTGPYMIDKVTANDMILKKNPYYYNLKNLKFNTIDEIQVNDLKQQYALLQAGKIDHFDGTQPKDILESMLAANKGLIHYRMVNYSCTGMLFNTKHTPFDNSTFRQAVIYALDRSKMRELANWYGHNTDFSTTGMPVGLVDKYVSKDVQAKMTKYNHDPNKAAELLESIGWKKGSDGIWKDPDGKAPNFIIAADSGSFEWTNAGETAAEQLTAFGLPTKFKAVEGSLYWKNVRDKDGQYDMSFNKMDVTWNYNDPWWSMSNTYWGDPMRDAHLPQNDMNHAVLVAKGYDGQTVDVDKLLTAMPYMKDEKERQHAINEIAYVTNESAWAAVIYQLVTGSWENSKMIGGLPMASDIAKGNRDLPEVAPDHPDFERILETNEGFSGHQWIIDGSYYPN